jgi:hypothetical protein
MHDGSALTYKDSSLGSGFGDSHYRREEPVNMGIQPIRVSWPYTNSLSLQVLLKRKGRVILDERPKFDSSASS